ncbi:hypothetical protein GCM10009541_02250 [Micromonospora gifhornensis]|uniref:Predicted membrane protein YciQ-like C-terminal domain-containing protein n=1 Tax=Micromonospora gifhornensis TaxID=84594 RepID=A0ABQ4IKF0_9ACTN|nr:DUF2207 domain-containing protein [Micromonospora gifhornensis]GIJ18373.1 hypothetical protein Vgi01_50570 [Micromonospora gifhornensis]
MFVDLAVSAVALVGWFAVYGAVRFATRPASPTPAPATMELGDEPPALVNMLANRWTVTEDAAEATLLDLAARGFVELRQPGDDPMQTTLHLPASPPDESGLRPYERRVLHRVRGLVAGGALPLTALTFRDQGQARAWNRRFRAEVVDHAREAGLSRRRFGPNVTVLLSAAALAAGVFVWLAVTNYGLSHPAGGTRGLAAGFFTFAVLSTLAAATPGERDTSRGAEVAARWLGVRDWLRGHEQFAELPPASVAIWDRYLGYGAALGTTHLTSAVLDLGMGDRKLVWSSYGGTWHRVRVRYPQGAHHGRTLPGLLLRAVLLGGPAVFMLKLFGPVADPTPTSDYPGAGIFPMVLFGLVVVAGLMLTRAVYTVVRAVVDMFTERTITGEVLWVQVWKSTSRGKNMPSRPWLYHLAVDDGSGDRTTAWGLPSQWAGDCHDGDTVTIRVRPWSRRVVAFAVVGHGRSRNLAEPVTHPSEMSAATGAGSPAYLITPEEIGQALGLAVHAPEAVDLPGPFTGVQFRAAGDGQPVLTIQAVSGTAAQWIWQLNTRGQELPGVGDGAYLLGERAVLRLGDRTLLVTLLGAARSRTASLPWLLTQAATRASADRPETTG